MDNARPSRPVKIGKALAPLAYISAILRKANEDDIRELYLISFLVETTKAPEVKCTFTSFILDYQQSK
jgi:hypothetical protein